MLRKPRRIFDPELLAEIRKAKCCIAGCCHQAEPAHIKSRGAGGDDIPENLVPLCTWHHTGEQHVIGWRKFREKHPEVKTWAEIQRLRRYEYGKI